MKPWPELKTPRNRWIEANMYLLFKDSLIINQLKKKKNGTLEILTVQNVLVIGTNNNVAITSFTNSDLRFFVIIRNKPIRLTLPII